MTLFIFRLNYTGSPAKVKRNFTVDKLRFFGMLRPMIDVSKITDLKELEEMKNDLNFFINKKIVAEIYRDEGKEDIELYVDRELARELLEQVKYRIARLSPPGYENESISSVVGKRGTPFKESLPVFRGRRVIKVFSG